MKRKRLLYEIACCLLFFVFYSTNVFAQNAKEKITINGTVKDNLGSLLNGAVVTNLKTRKNTQTDGSGNFAISASVGDSLSASYPGYLDFKWVFTDRLSFDIVLTAVSGSLNEVIVTGFGTKQKQVGLVGSVASVDA